MKATVQYIAGRYRIIGLDFVGIKESKEAYEPMSLHAFAGKSYAKEENAIKALTNKGYTYVPADKIVIIPVLN